jgi:hypothetical protein
MSRRSVAFDRAERMLEARDPRWARFEETMLTHLDWVFGRDRTARTSDITTWLLASYAYCRHRTPATRSALLAYRRRSIKRWRA